MSKKVHFILEGTNYNVFKYSKGQRVFRSLKHIMRSMRQVGFWWWKPIHVKPAVNGIYEIIDGHHRFEVAKYLKIPFYYIVVSDPNYNIIEANLYTNPFVLKDFLEVFKNTKVDVYVKMHEYISKTGCGLSDAIKMFSGVSPSGGGGKEFVEFKTGNWRPVDTRKPESVKDVLLALKNHVDWGNQRFSVKAIYALINLKQFSVKRFIERINSHPEQLQKCVDRDSYIDMYERLYNFRFAESKRVNLKYLVMQSEVSK